ncbi:MAG: vWA domain-containing protein [Betaproteobacteria bacterium]
MYPFGSLPLNLIAFGRVLRVEHGFRIGAGELRDAARALEIVDLSDERAVRDALRPVLSSTEADTRAFDQAFTTFFFPGPAGVPQRPMSRARVDADDPADPGIEAGHRPASGGIEEEEGPAPPVAPVEPLATAGADAAARALVARASYSPLDADADGEAPELTRAEPAWREAARALVRRLQFGLSRRWQPAPRGQRFHLRRTLRASLQTGGEALTVRWLRRPRRTPRFVLLIDGSRSMGAYARTALRIAVALAGATVRLEAFTFSTALQRVTNDVRRAAAGETRPLEPAPHAWAGGTSIGRCLRDFLLQFGARLVGRDTIVVIVSDGLDVGEPDVLRAAMRELHRRSAGVVWLNPLLETAGYEPSAAGMRAARPYITTFACVNDPAGLARLSRLVRARA